MPLRECTVNGEKGWQFGNQHCFTGPHAKQKCIKQMIAIFGPDKFQSHLHEKAFVKEEFGGKVDWHTVKAALEEHYKEEKKKRASAFKSIASYLSSKADPGQNSTSVNRGTFLDDENDKGTAAHSDYVDNGSSLSNSDQKDVGSDNEFNKPGEAAKKPPKTGADLNWSVNTGEKPSSDFTCDEHGETVYDPQKQPASADVTWDIDEGKPAPDSTKKIKPDSKASTNWSIDTGPAAPDSTSHPATETVNDPQDPSKAGEDMYGKNGKNDNDGDEPDPKVKASLKDGKPTESQVGATEDENNNSSLDKNRQKVGSTGVVPPYNHSASPETGPGSDNVKNYPVYNKQDTGPHGTDNRMTQDPTVQYKVKSEMSPKPDDLEMSMGDKTITNIPEGEDIVKKSVSEEVWMNACAYISEKERDKVPDEDFAGPKGSRSFPIRNGKDVEDAARLVGHSPNPSATKKRIIEIAHRKGLHAHLPESWKKPEHQTAYEQALMLFNKLTAGEKKSLKAKLTPEFEEQAVNGPQETAPGA